MDKEDSISHNHQIEDINVGGLLVEEVEHEYDDSLQCDEIEGVDVHEYNVNESFDNHESGDGQDLNNNEGEKIVGTIFDTLEEAYTFYNDYALLHGFGIHYAHRNRITNVMYRRQFVCDMQGFKRATDHCAKQRRETRTGCNAMLQVTKTKDKKWLSINSAMIIIMYQLVNQK